MLRLPLVRLKPTHVQFLVEGIGSFILTLTAFLANARYGNLVEVGSSFHPLWHLAPVAIGFMLAVLVFTFGYISGAHFNPAVTLGVMLANVIRVELAIMYVVAQCAGCMLAAIFGAVVAGAGPDMPAPAIHDTTPEHILRGFMAEGIFTAALVTTVLHVACSRQKNNQFFGFAIGATLMCSLFAVGGISGGGFNPALSTALQVVKCGAGYCGPLLNLWVYWAAPAAGAFGAAVVFKMVHPRQQQVDRAAEALY